MKVREIVDTKSRSDWEHLIDEWIHSERDRAMLKRHLLDCISIQQLAEDFDLSWVQAQHILHKCKIQLFKHC